MIDTIVIAFGALMVATLAAALLAPVEAFARRSVLCSQWSAGQMPPAAPRCGYRAS
jgi:hypothetical protein